MTILAIETSTPCGSVTVFRESAVLHDETFSADRSHNALLFSPLRRALDACPEKPDLILVGTGPGSYTGIRIGIAAGHGVAMALGIPLAGWTSFSGWSEATSFDAVGDARRGGWYHASIREGRMAEGPRIHPLEAWPDHPPSDPIPTLTTDASPLGPGVRRVTPSAARLAAAFLRLDRDSQLGAGRRPIEPIYLREPHITAPKTPFP